MRCRDRLATVDDAQSMAKLLNSDEYRKVGRCMSDLPISETIDSRREHPLGEGSLEELAELNRKMAERYRRNAEGVACEIVPDEELEKSWEAFAVDFVCGLQREGQLPGEEIERLRVGTGSPQALPHTASSLKGSKAHLEPTPNQDNFSILHFKNGYSLACCMDGHGPDGHMVASRTAKTLPLFLSNSLLFPYNPQGALIEAFERAQQDVVSWSLKNGTDIQASGTTAVAVVWKGAKVWVANVGDSRCVIGSRVSHRITFITSDHKPDVPEERTRLETGGGEVRSKVCGPDGWVVHRVFVEGQDYPGLAMSRSLGDETVKNLGVIATPEIHEVAVDLDEQPFILLATDGVWEFIMPEDVIKGVAKRLRGTDGPGHAIKWLQNEAQNQWRLEEGEYCDDITSVLLLLSPLQQPNFSCCNRRRKPSAA